MASRVERLIERQAEDLDRLDEREARAFLRAYQDARREILEDLQRMVAQGLDTATPYTAHVLRMMLAQSEKGVHRLVERLGGALDKAVSAQQDKALENLIGMLSGAESDFVDAGSRIEHEVLRRISEQNGLLLHRYSMNRYGSQLVETIQRELVTGVARGQSFRELTERIAGIKGSVLEGAKFRAELIVRMEMNRAYNDAHLEALRAGASELDTPGDDDPLLKRADEYKDLRNHAISRVLHGQVVGIEELFHAPRARVEAEHQAIQEARRKKRLRPRRLSGILWEIQGADYVGLNYPVHFWERGRITAWRRSWEEPTSSPQVERTEKTGSGESILPQTDPGPDPRIIMQEHDSACGPAVAEMLARMHGAENIDRAGLMRGVASQGEGGRGITGPDLAAKMNEHAPLKNRRWAGGSVFFGDASPRDILKSILKNGPFGALIERSPNRGGHWILVVGQRKGMLEILDPAGLRYKVSVVEFLRKWPVVALFPQ